MIDPFSAWLRLMDAAAGMARTGSRASETLSASNDVIAKRSAIISSAMAVPLTADYAEISRIVPEKIEAFSRSGLAVLKEWTAINAALLAEAQHLGTMAMRGRWPTMGEVATQASRNASFAVAMTERTARLGAVALAPIHTAVAANARRL